MSSFDFIPNKEQLDILALASPFALQIYQKHTQRAEAFLGEFGFGTPMTRADFDGLVRRFVGLGTTYYLDSINEEMVMQGLRELRRFLMLKWI